MKTLAQRQGQARQPIGGFVPAGQVVKKEPATPLQLIQDALAEGVAAELGADQAARYRRELELRVAEEKETAVVRMVAWLDQVLLFSPDQRQALVKGLSKSYDRSWVDWSEDNSPGNNYLPAAPEKVISPVLTKLRNGPSGTAR